MYIRHPAVAGSFYPEGRELERLITNLLREVKPCEKFDARAIIAPHAGYAFCGKTLARVYSSLEPNYETAVILAPNHHGLDGIATCTGLWKTPLGNLRTDNEFIEAMLEHCPLTDNPEAHAWEHAVEVQLPWIITCMGNVKIVPVTINPVLFDTREMKELGEAVHAACSALERKTIVIASTDFTHYGRAYGYVPFTGSTSEVLRKIRENDMRILRAVEHFAVERVIELGSQSTVCGYGAVAAALHHSKLSGAKRAKLVDYRTSFEVSKSTDAIVAYAGVVLF